MSKEDTLTKELRITSYIVSLFALLGFLSLTILLFYKLRIRFDKTAYVLLTISFVVLFCQFLSPYFYDDQDFKILFLEAISAYFTQTIPAYLFYRMKIVYIFLFQ